MKDSIDILDAIARHLGDATDYRIAQVTGIPAPTICSIRAGRIHLSRADCKRAALALSVEAGALIAIVQAAREPDKEIRASLLRVAKRGMAAAAIAALIGGASYAPETTAGTAGATSATRGLCIMLNHGRRRRWRPARRKMAPAQPIVAVSS